MRTTIAIRIFLSMVILLSVIASALANDFELPEMHFHVALQMEGYRDGDSTYVTAQPRAAENAFIIRHAALEAEGEYGDYLEYNMEIGAASCVGGGLMIMEVGIFYKPYDFIKAGFMKGHVMRGFEMYEECVNLTTAEKPVSAKKFSPCHPTGLVVEVEHNLNETMGVHSQFAYMNGTGGSFDGEHDISLGLQFRTPFPGLMLAGFYTDWQQYTMIEGESDMISVDGYRTGFGGNFDEYNIHLRGEYYYGKGFDDICAGASFEDMEMKTYFIEGGYTFNIGQERLSYVQPYIQYQWWDQASNVEGGNDETQGQRGRGEAASDNEADYVFSLLTLGASFGIGPNDTKLRIEYQTVLEFPDNSVIVPYGEKQAADRLIVRIQTGI